MYRAAHAYTSRWRVQRCPTALLPGALGIFRSRIHPCLFDRAYNVAKFGVRPRAVYPAIRANQKPYSSVADNPLRTAADLWDDIVKGRLMIFTLSSEHLVGELMESRLAFVAQKDVAKADGVKVRYISDPMGEINERIYPRTRPWVRVPRHANVIRRSLHWKRRYPTIPVLLCKRDAKGHSSFPHYRSVG